MSKQKRKIGKLSHDRTNASSEGHVVVFGTQRIGAIYALRAGIDPRRVRLCTEGMEALHGSHALGITVVRVSEDAWQPPTNPCAARTREVEQALKTLREGGVAIRDVMLD